MKEIVVCGWHACINNISFTLGQIIIVAWMLLSYSIWAQPMAKKLYFWCFWLVSLHPKLTGLQFIKKVKWKSITFTIYWGLEIPRIAQLFYLEENKNDKLLLFIIYLNEFYTLQCSTGSTFDSNKIICSRKIDNLQTITNGYSMC